MVTWTIAWKEFRSFINSPIAYIFLSIFVLVLSGTFLIWGKAGQGTFYTLGIADLTLFFASMPMALAVMAPALSMMLWPDELKSGTIELLLSYPLRSWQVVLGKFVAGLLLIATALLISMLTPMAVSSHGNLDWGPVLGSYLASLLMGAAFLSLGLFMGALCKEQVTAFILTLGVCALFVLMGDVMFNIFIPKGWHDWSNALSFSTRFNDLGRGVVSIKDTLYFASVSAVFLLLNITVIECRKGR